MRRFVVTPLSCCRVVALLLVSCCALTLRAQIVRDSAIIQVQSHIPDSLPGRNIVSRHLNWVQRTFLRPFLDDANEAIPNDTNYVIKPGEKLRLGASLNMTGANMTLSGYIDDNYKFTMPLRAQAKTSIGVNACYRGLTIGFSFSPFHLGGKNHDIDFSLSMYNDRFGGDIMFHSAKTFSGKFSAEDLLAEDLDIPRGSIRQTIIGLNGYYAFRWKRFALPAVFDQSWIQRRSAGSGLLGGTMMMVDIQKLIDTDPSQLKFRLFYPAIGGGYGYNWVCAHHWLIHFDALLEIVPYVFGKATIGTEKKRYPYKYPPVMAVGRFGVMHYFHRCYVGLNMRYNDITVGQADELQLKTNKWNLSLFFGVRI